METGLTVQVSTLTKTVYEYKLMYPIVPDPCLEKLCDVNAMCEREGLLSSNFTCTCVEPYTDGDGFNCSGTYIYM